MMESKGIASESDQRRRDPAPFGRWDQAVRFLAGSLVLVGLIYATWRFGGVQATALRDLALLFIVANALVLLSPRVWSCRRRLPVVFPAVVLAFVAFAWIQGVALEGETQQRIAESVCFAENHVADEQVSLLRTAADHLGNQRPIQSPVQHGSIVPELTRQATVPFVLALMIAIVSAVVFTTRRARTIYLWTLVANASALSVWGIIQRANGDRQILPGYEMELFSTPFASFTYKNAGAAALLPAIAIVAALLLIRRRTKRPRVAYGTGSELLSTRNTVLVVVGGLLLAGLLTTLSRGAWISALCGAALVVGTMRFAWIWRRHTMAAIGIALTIAVAVSITGVRQNVLDRAERLSFETVKADQRWIHWIDGFEAAKANLVYGSGLGTYGYAILPHQAKTHRSWFQNAHNQFLETAVETGLIGIGLIAIAIVWLGIVSRRLSQSSVDVEWRRWGLIGLALLSCGIVQSVFDYVLLIPANMLLYASLIGIIGRIALDSATLHKAADGGRTLIENGGFPLVLRRISLTAWCGVSIGSGIWAFDAAADSTVGHQALAATSLETLDERPSLKLVESNLQLLGSAIAQQPGNAALYNRRASWNLVRYRLKLVEVAADSAVQLPWLNTTPEHLFSAIATQRPGVGEGVREDLLATEDMRRSIADTLADLAASLVRNPYQPGTHLDCAYLAPLAGMPVDRWTQSAAPLVNNSHSMLFANGVLAFHSGDIEMAIDQWQKSLSIQHHQLIPIINLASQKLPPLRVATEIVPASRPEFLVRLLRSVAEQDPDDAAPLADGLVALLETNLDLDTGIRYATIARIHQISGRDDEAVDRWQDAVESHRRNLDYRWGYAHALRSTGLLEKALDQVTLGQAMGPEDQRFEKLAVQIRREIGTAGSLRK